MASSTDAVPINKNILESDKLCKDDSEADVPDDFFDDFSNNDFMAGLDVVDAWDDGLNIGLNVKREGGRVVMREREEVKFSPMLKVASKGNLEVMNDNNIVKVSPTKIMLNDSKRSNTKETDKLKENNPTLPVIKTKIENMDQNLKNYKLIDSDKNSSSPNTIMPESKLKNTFQNKSIQLFESTSTTIKDPDTSSTDSDSNKAGPVLDLKDLKLNSQCKVILDRDDWKSFTKDKLKVVSSTVKDVKEPEQKDLKEDSKSKNSSVKDVKVAKISSKDSKTLKADFNVSKSGKDKTKDQLKSRKLSDGVCNLKSDTSRRDPERTKKDIQRNKQKVTKDIESKFVDEKLRLVETGLVPPGTEMDVDLSKQVDEGSREVIEDLRNKIRGGGRERKDRDREPRSDSRDRNRDSASSRGKRRHSDQNKPPHTKRSKDNHPPNTLDENVSVTPSPERQIHINKSSLLDRRGRYNAAADSSPERENRRLPPSPSRNREHSNSSSRRTLTIAEEMVRSLQLDPDGQQQQQSVMGKGDRIPRRAMGRSRSRSRSYEKYRAYKRSPSPPTMRGYGGAGGLKDLGGPRVRLAGGREGSRRSRERSPPLSSRDRQRERDRRSSRDRSLSPSLPQERRKKAPTFLEELNEKLSKQQSHNPSRERRSFLEEIREKINQQTGSSNFNPQYGAQLTAPIPAPVPAPHQFHQQIPPTPIVYDQSFFIGKGSAIMPQGGPHMLNMPQSMFGLPAVGQSQLMSSHLQQPMTQQPQMPLIPMQPSAIHAPIAQQLPVLREDQTLDKRSIAKLFSDKQITLTDFLSITSKVAGFDRPVDIAKKIKVISRCQDAIKVISKDSKTNGRFFFRKSPAQRFNQSADNLTSSNMFISPFKHNPPVRFRFTSKVPFNDEILYRTNVQLLLHKLGLPDGSEPVRNPTPDPQAESQPAPEVYQQPYHSKPLIIQQANNLKSVVPTSAVVIAPPLKKEVLQKMCQTDPVNLCRECKVRSEKKFVSVGCQYDEQIFVNVGTQVNGTEDAFTPARANLQGLLKSRSLASLTPAQILAQVASTKTKEVINVKFNSQDSKRSRIEPNQWQLPDERERNCNRGLMTTSRRTDEYSYNEQQRERYLQQHLQMTMDSQQQKNRVQQFSELMYTREMNLFPGLGKFEQDGNNSNSAICGGSNNPEGMGGYNFQGMAAGSGQQFGGPSHNSNMMDSSGFNQRISGRTDSNQFGGNQQFGGDRYYNY